MQIAGQFLLSRLLTILWHSYVVWVNPLTDFLDLIQASGDDDWKRVIRSKVHIFQCIWKWFQLKLWQWLGGWQWWFLSQTGSGSYLIVQGERMDDLSESNKVFISPVQLSQSNSLISKWVRHDWRGSFARMRGELFSTFSFIKSICHAPLPKIRENGVAMRVGDVYTRGKYPTHIR